MSSRRRRQRRAQAKRPLLETLVGSNLPSTSTTPTHTPSPPLTPLTTTQPSQLFAWRHPALTLTLDKALLGDEAVDEVVDEEEEEEEEVEEEEEEERCLLVGVVGPVGMLSRSEQRSRVVNAALGRRVVHVLHVEDDGGEEVQVRGERIRREDEEDEEEEEEVETVWTDEVSGTSLQLCYDPVLRVVFAHVVEAEGVRAGVDDAAVCRAMLLLFLCCHHVVLVLEGPQLDVQFLQTLRSLAAAKHLAPAYNPLPKAFRRAAQQSVPSATVLVPFPHNLGEDLSWEDVRVQTRALEHQLRTLGAALGVVRAGSSVAPQSPDDGAPVDVALSQLSSPGLFSIESVLAVPPSSPSDGLWDALFDVDEPLAPADSLPFTARLPYFQGQSTAPVRHAFAQRVSSSTASVDPPGDAAKQTSSAPANSAADATERWTTLLRSRVHSTLTKLRSALEVDESQPAKKGKKRSKKKKKKKKQALMTRTLPLLPVVDVAHVVHAVRAALFARRRGPGLSATLAELPLSGAVGVFSASATSFSSWLCMHTRISAVQQYQTGLPHLYTQREHEARVQKAVALFRQHAGGPCRRQAEHELVAQLHAIWQDGHRQCEAQSLSSNLCALPADHDTPHANHIQWPSACACGRSQVHLPDLFIDNAFDVVDDEDESMGAVHARVSEAAERLHGMFTSDCCRSRVEPLWAAALSPDVPLWSRGFAVLRLGGSQDQYAPGKGLQWDGFSSRHREHWLHRHRVPDSNFVFYAGVLYECPLGHRFVLPPDDPDDGEQRARPDSRATLHSPSFPLQDEWLVVDCAVCERVEGSGADAAAAKKLSRKSRRKRRGKNKRRGAARGKGKGGAGEPQLARLSHIVVGTPEEQPVQLQLQVRVQCESAVLQEHVPRGSDSWSSALGFSAASLSFGLPTALVVPPNSLVAVSVPRAFLMPKPQGSAAQPVIPVPMALLEHCYVSSPVLWAAET